MPVSAGNFCSRLRKASRPPADAPTPTMGKIRLDSATVFFRGMSAFLSTLTDSDPMEALENVARCVAQRDRPPVRAAHRTRCRGQRSEQPLYLGRFQARVDLDGRPAGNRRRHGAANVVERSAAKLPLG